MRFNRFALVAGVLALGVAACGDDVQVVEPTPPPPPPPPALSASMAPASAEVEVGSSVVFAVNVSGGVAGRGGQLELLLVEYRDRDGLDDLGRVSGDGCRGRRCDDHRDGVEGQ